MKREQRGLYSIVQYVPDPGRAEAANVGVVLFLPSSNSVEFRYSHSLSRVRKFFAPGKIELENIEIALEALKNRLGMRDLLGQEEFERFVAARADAVRLTPPRVSTVIDPVSELERMFTELVEKEPKQLLSHSKKPDLPQYLENVLKSLVTAGKAWKPGKITIPTIGRKLDVSMAYQNGVTNYVRAEQLVKGIRLESRLERLSFDGQLIHQHEVDGRKSKLVVLSADPHAEPDFENRCESVLSDFNVRFVPHSQVDEFADEVKKTAHKQSPFSLTAGSGN